MNLYDFYTFLGITKEEEAEAHNFLGCLGFFDSPDLKQLALVALAIKIKKLEAKLEAK